jgi:hypothetical protein
VRALPQPARSALASRRIPMRRLAASIILPSSARLLSRRRHALHTRSRAAVGVKTSLYVATCGGWMQTTAAAGDRRSRNQPDVIRPRPEVSARVYDAVTA